MPTRPKTRTSKARLGKVNHIPSEFAHPIRMTSYIHPYPHTLHAGKMMPGEEREFGSVLNWNLHRHDDLTRLKMISEVDYTTSRTIDARGQQAIP